MNTYDYGFGELHELDGCPLTLLTWPIIVFPCGSHTSPGAQAGVPVILPIDIAQVL